MTMHAFQCFFDVCFLLVTTMSLVVQFLKYLIFYETVILFVSAEVPNIPCKLVNICNLDCCQSYYILQATMSEEIAEKVL